MSSNPTKQIYYSEKYYDDVFEYRYYILLYEGTFGESFNNLHSRHVMLPKEIAKMVPRNRLMTETEWRHLGVQQSQGWIHYMQHAPGRVFINLLPLPDSFCTNPTD